MTPTTRDVLDWVVRFVREKRLSPGDVLPNEIEIAEKLSVGRSSVRESFAMLRAFGIVRSKPGVGPILIADYRRLDLMTLFTHDRFELSDYHAFRQLRNFLELGSAEVIIQKAKPDDIRHLRQLVDMVSSGDISPLEFEIQFHEYLAGLTGNRFIIALSLLYRPLFEYHTRHRLTTTDQRTMPKHVIAGHRRVVDALEGGDRMSLIEAMHGTKLLHAAADQTGHTTTVNRKG